MAWYSKRNRVDHTQEQRTITTVPWDVGGPMPSHVNSENAASLIPVFACMRIIADNIAALPIETFKKSGQDLQPQSFTPPLFFKPASRDNIFQWVHKCIVSMVLRGNAYGLVTARDQLGFPSMVEWLHPDDVHVDETSTIKPLFYWQGVLQDTSSIIHIPWIVQPGRVVGMSPVQAFAATMGVGLAATEYGRRWFDNGGTPPSVMKNTAKTVGPDESAEIKKRASKAIKSGEPLVIGSDWDFNAIRVNPEESQFIQTMKLNATQIAAIYGVPAEMAAGETGGSLTYSTVEQNSLNLASLTLRPWIVRLETAFSEVLANGEEVRFNIDAMIRVSILTRYQAHAIGLASGFLNVDEVRKVEKLPPLPNGEGKVYKVQSTAPPVKSDPLEPAPEGVTS